MEQDFNKVSGWHKLKNHFPGLNHSRAVLAVRQTLGTTGRTLLKIEETIRQLVNVREPITATDIENVFENLRERLSETGRGIEESLFKVDERAAFDSFSGGDIASLRQMKRLVHLRHAAIWAQNAMSRDVGHPLLTDNMRSRAYEHLDRAWLDPDSDESWGIIGVPGGKEQACHHLIYNLRKQFVEPFHVALAAAPTPLQRIAAYLDGAQVILQECGPDNRDKYKRAGFDLCDAALEVAGFSKLATANYAPKTLVDLEQGAYRYKKLMDHDTGVLLHLRDYLENGADSNERVGETIEGLINGLENAGWNRASPELWEIIKSAMPEEMLVGITGLDQILERAHLHDAQIDERENILRGPPADKPDYLM